MPAVPRYSVQRLVSTAATPRRSISLSCTVHSNCGRAPFSDVEVADATMAVCFGRTVGENRRSTKVGSSGQQAASCIPAHCRRVLAACSFRRVLDPQSQVVCPPRARPRRRRHRTAPSWIPAGTSGMALFYRARSVGQASRPSHVLMNFFRDAMLFRFGEGDGRSPRSTTTVQRCNLFPEPAMRRRTSHVDAGGAAYRGHADQMTGGDAVIQKSREPRAEGEKFPLFSLCACHAYPTKVTPAMTARARLSSAMPGVVAVVSSVCALSWHVVKRLVEVSRERVSGSPQYPCGDGIHPDVVRAITGRHRVLTYPPTIPLSAGRMGELLASSPRSAIGEDFFPTRTEPSRRIKLRVSHEGLQPHPFLGCFMSAACIAA